MRWLDGITNMMDMSLSKLWELVMDTKPGVLQSMVSQRVGHNRATELNWAKIKDLKCHNWDPEQPNKYFLKSYQTFCRYKQADTKIYTDEIRIV